MRPVVKEPACWGREPELALLFSDDGREKKVRIDDRKVRTSECGRHEDIPPVGEGNQRIVLLEKPVDESGSFRARLATRGGAHFCFACLWCGWSWMAFWAKGLGRCEWV